jgi:hypothetical protein
MKNAKDPDAAGKELARAMEVGLRQARSMSACRGSRHEALPVACGTTCGSAYKLVFFSEQSSEPFGSGLARRTNLLADSLFCRAGDVQFLREDER